MPRRPSSAPDSLGAYIRKWRRDHELTVAELADRLGWSRSYLSLVENGTREVGEKLVIYFSVNEGNESFEKAAGLETCCDDHHCETK